MLLSELTDSEIQDAPDEVRKVYAKFLECTSKIIEIGSEAVELAGAYLKHRILTHKYRDDARHIAIAAVAGADREMKTDGYQLARLQSVKSSRLSTHIGRSRVKSI